MTDTEKEELKKGLNDALQLKNKIREASQNERAPLIAELRGVCDKCLQLANKLELDHGKALSLEMSTFAKLTELTDNHVEEEDQYTSLESQIIQAQKIAREFGDRALENRLFELHANIYLRIGRHDKEIECIEKACAIQRTLPKMVALLDANSRMLDSLFSTPKPDSDLLLKYNADYWEIYLWLRDQGKNLGFNKVQFVKGDKRRAGQLFKVALYIGSFSGNPLHGGQTPENLKMGMDAFDEAIWLANVLDNKEYLCAATAHKASIIYHKLTPEEKRELMHNLKSMQEKYEPENSELIDIIDSLTKGPGGTTRIPI